MPPAEDRAKLHYQGDAGRRYHESKRSIPEEAFQWIAQLRAEKISPHVRETDRVLEYGVGLGWNLAALTCAAKIGYDVGEFLEAEVRRRGIEFALDPNGVAADSMDVVVCHHTLEHVLQPVEVLTTISRWLRPGGRLLLYVPYEKERRLRQFNPDEANHHLYSWNPQTLGNLTREAGFEVEYAWLGRFGQERFAANLATRFGLGEPGFRALHWVANRLLNEHEVRVCARKPQV